MRSLQRGVCCGGHFAAVVILTRVLRVAAWSRTSGTAVPVRAERLVIFSHYIMSYRTISSYRIILSDHFIFTFHVSLHIRTHYLLGNNITKQSDKEEKEEERKIYRERQRETERDLDREKESRQRAIASPT